MEGFSEQRTSRCFPSNTADKVLANLRMIPLKELPMLFKVFSCLMVLLLLIIPCLTFAQQTNDAAQAIADATHDAKYAPNSSLWFPAGCVLGVVGILVAAVYTPHPKEQPQQRTFDEYLLQQCIHLTLPQRNCWGNHPNMLHTIHPLISRSQKTSKLKRRS